MALSTLLTTFLAATASANIVHEALQGRQSNSSAEDAYLQTVCFPPTTAPVVPPCQSILNIESACQPNGTAPIDLIAHAECMCGGSYFEDWIGCLDCDYVHGARSPQIVSDFNTILTSASHALCTGTPTAVFSVIFADINDGFSHTGTNTGTSDLYPSQTAISLYYTPTGTQGPGPITGSATLATKSGSAAGGGSGAKTASGSTSKATGSAVSSSSASAQGTSASTSSSKAGAAPTGVWMGALGVMAGGAAIAAL